MLTIHGTGCLIRVYRPDNPLFHFASKFEKDLLAKNILNNLPSLPNQKHTTYLDYEPDEHYTLFKADTLTRLEIKTNEQRYKLFLNDVTRNDLLFPSEFMGKNETLYFENNALYITEEVIGNFGSCIINEKKFYPKLLKMNCINFDKNNYIHKIYYNQSLLCFDGKDLLNRGLYMIMNE